MQGGVVRDRECIVANSVQGDLEEVPLGGLGAYYLDAGSAEEAMCGNPTMESTCVRRKFGAGIEEDETSSVSREQCAGFVDLTDP